MHGGHVCDQILIDYVKSRHQIERHLEFCLETLALNVASDVKESVLVCYAWTSSASTNGKIVSTDIMRWWNIWVGKYELKWR